jgi:Zn-dependent protease
MRERGLKIGRIFGIEIHLDWSWFFIFVLITWNLATVIGQAHPEWQIALRWGTALIASLLFFASVLAHELAHSIMARAHGIPVRHITLMLFGGVANIQREPPSPSAQFQAPTDGFYAFEARAVDVLGLVEGFNNQAEATVFVDAEPPFLTSQTWLLTVIIVP